MRSLSLSALVALCAVSTTQAYIESPYTLGRTCNESTNVLLVEVTGVNQEKGLIYFKKVKDLKGNHAGDEIKHNIGKRGYHEREWKNVMAWAAVGKKAVVFHNGTTSETCIGTYWYECHKQNEWWGMSHAEPFLMRTYFGAAEKLAEAVGLVVAGKEVVIPCLADGNKEQFHLGKGKVQRLKASLKRLDYNVPRDFVGFGSSASAGEREKTHVVGAERLKIEGTFKAGDSKVKFAPVAGANREYVSQLHQVKLTGGKRYKITMDSTDVDSVLVIFTDDGKYIGWDDDSGGKLNSLYMLTVNKDATFKIYTCSLRGNVGNYVFRIAEVRETSRP